MQAHADETFHLRSAIDAKDKALVEKLLYHGAGMFRDLPENFMELDVNASHCYVQGMTIAGKRVTHATRGFHQAFFSVEEIKQCKLKKDGLIPNATRRGIPFSQLQVAFYRYENDIDRDANPEFMQAAIEFEALDKIPSLRSLAFQTLMKHDIPFEQVNPEHECVTMLLQERIAELMELLSHINELTEDATRADELEQLEVVLLYIFGILTGSTTLLFFGYSMTLLLASICCGCPAPFQAAQLFFGIPGGIVALLAVVTAIFTINRLRQHGCDGVCKPVMQTRIRDNYQLASILDRLIAIMRSEQLPADIEQIVQELESAGIGFECAIKHIATLINHYTYTEMSHINRETSQTPLLQFNAGSFFWTEAKRNAYRNNHLPKLIVMKDEEQGSLTEVGHLFQSLNIMQRIDADQRPGVVSMSDDADFPMFSVNL